MKKKFIQILMLLIATVSMGSFVSCKDTSEDLYNELRTQSLSENASLKEALDAYEQKLNQQITLYENLQQELNAVKKDSISKLTALLSEQFGLIVDLQNDLAGKANQSEVDELRRLIDMLKDQLEGDEGIIINLNNLISNDAAQDALIETLGNDIATLKTWKEQLEIWRAGTDQNIADVLTWLNTLQTQMTKAQADIEAAMNKAIQAEVDATAAKQMADLAYAMAQNAQDIANTAKNTADVAASTADKAYELATNAQAAADAAKGVADRALALAESNEGRITKLEEKVDALGQQIADMNANLSTLTEQVNKALADAAEALGKANANSQEIAVLKNDVDNIKNALDNFQSALDKLANYDSKIDSLTYIELKELTETVNCHTAELATLEVECGLILAESIAHFEAAKCYAEKLVAAAILQMQNWVKDQLKDYLLKSDVDLTKYVTKEDFENYKQHVKDTYATKVDLLNELKDYIDEDTFNAFKTDLATKLGGIDTKLDGLDGAIAALNTALSNLITEMNNKFLEQANTIGDLRDRIGQLEGLYNTLKEQVENCLTKAEFEAWKENIKGQISNIIGNQQGNTNLAEIFNGWHLTITTDCTKILNEKLAEIKAEIMAELLADGSFTEDLADILIDDFGFLTADDIAGLSDALTKLTELEAKLAGIEDYADRIKALEDEITKLAQLELEVATLKSTAITMDDLADYVKASDLATMLNDYVKKEDLPVIPDLSNLATKDELNDLINTLNDYAKKTDLAGYATKDDLNNYATKDDIADFVTVGDLAAYAKTEDLALYAKLTDLNDYVKKSDFNSAKEELLDKIGANTTAINEVKDQIKDINDEITSIKDDVKDLQDRVKATEDKITELETKVDNIKKDVTAIQNKLAKQVTSIIVQGTRNPMFGTFSIPANIQSNILLAYYGVPVSDVEFPTSKTGLYGIRADEAFTAEEIALLKEMGLEEVFETPAGEPLLAENGNAGKVYMTINPNTADLTGLKLSIVNTLDKEAPIKLSAIRKSTDQLQFGYSRADNGFYEADAYVEPATAKYGSNGIPITKDEIKATFGDIKNKIKDILKSDEKGEMTIGDIATDVYTIVRGLKADQNGLKCTYTTTEADATETEHSVYSQYNLAATFLQPLNLDTGKDFNYKTIPGYERAEAFLKDIAKKLKEKVHTAFVDLNSSDLIKSVIGLEIKEVKLVDLSDELIAKFQITIGDDVTIDGMTYHMQIPADSDIPVMLAKGLTVNGKPVNIPSDLMIDPDKPKAKYPTLVIMDDVTSTNVTMKLVLPVTNDALEQYLWYDLENNEVEAVYNADDVLVLNTKNVFKFTETTSSYNVAPLTTPVVKVDNMIDLSSGTTPTLHLEFTYDLRKEMVDLWSTAQGAIADVNDMLDDIRKIIEEVNNTLDKINKYEGKINNEIDNVVENYLMKYLDKINTTIVDFVNSFNRRLQPFMIASTSKGLKRVSGVKDYPTKLTSDVTIYPTSKTMELIVPFARKHVAVTNVFKGAASAQGGDSDCKSKMTAANTGNDRLNKVIDGNVRKIDVSGLEKGYVYEFAYSVLDFDGNMATHRYYIEIQ